MVCLILFTTIASFVLLHHASMSLLHFLWSVCRSDACSVRNIFQEMMMIAQMFDCNDNIFDFMNVLLVLTLTRLCRFAWGKDRVS